MPAVAVLRPGAEFPGLKVALVVDIWLQSAAVAASSLTALRLPRQACFWAWA